MQSSRPLKKSVLFHLAGIFLLGLVFRFWGLSHDLPAVYHMDTPKVVNTAVQFYLHGHLSPHDWDKPTAHMHLYALAMSAYSAVRNLALNSSAFFSHTFANVVAGPLSACPYLSEFEAYFICRVVSALGGALLPLLMFWLLGLLVNARAGLIGAWLCALCPDLVEYAHTENVYMLLTVFTFASFALALRSYSSSSPRFWLGAAGFMAGVAFQTQFNALLLAFPLTICALQNCWRLTKGKTRGAKWLALLTRYIWLWPVCALAGMIVSDPYFVLDMSGFVNGILDKFFVYSKPFERDWSFEDPIFVVIVKILSEGLTPAVFILALGGPGLAAVKLRSKALFLFSFPLAYVAFMANVTVVFPRYFLCLLPFLLVFAAFVLERIFMVLQSKKRRPAYLIVPLMTALLVLPFWENVENGLFFSLRDTRQSAGEWLTRNLPVGTNVFTEKYEPEIAPGRLMLSRVFSLSDHALETYKANGARYLITSNYLSRRYTLRHSPERVARYRLKKNTLRRAAHFKLKNLILFYHPTISIYEILPAGVPRDPLPVLLPNPPQISPPNYDVLYLDNLMPGRDNLCFEPLNGATLTRYLKTDRPFMPVGVLICNNAETTRVKVTLGGRSKKLRLAPYASHLEVFPAPRGAFAQLHGLCKMTAQIQGRSGAFIKIIYGDFYLGEILLRQNRPQEAAPFFVSALNQNPRDLMSRLYLERIAGQNPPPAKSVRQNGPENLERLSRDLAENEWNVNFYRIFGLNPAEMESLRTENLELNAGLCFSDKYVWCEPLPVPRIISAARKDKSGTLSPVISRILRLERGSYRVSFQLQAQANDVHAATLLIKDMRGHVRLEQNLSPSQNGLCQADFTVRGYDDPLNLMILTANRVDFSLKSIQIRPLIRASLLGELDAAKSPATVEQK